MPEKLRILFALNCYHPVINGVVVSADTSAEELERQGHQILFLVPSRRGRKDTSRVVHCPSTLRMKQESFPFLAWPSPRVLWRIWKFRPQIIHLHHCFGVCVVAWLLGRLLGVPIVYQNHTMIGEYGASYAPRYLKRFTAWLGNHWNAFFANRCRMVFAPGESMRQYLEARGVRAPIRVVPTGIDIVKLSSRIQLDIRRKFGIPEGIPLLTYAGRVGHEKNIPLLLCIIAALVKKRGRDFHFVIAGPGSLISSSREVLAQQGLADCVTFTDGIPREQLINLLLESELFVFPSVTETQGLATLEAMLCGLAIVGANAMGTANLVRDGKNGFLINMNQNEAGIVAAFVRAIQRLLDDEKLRTRFGEASRRMAEQYDLSICVQKMVSAYREYV